MTSYGSPSPQLCVDALARSWAVKMAGDQAGDLKEDLELWLSKSPQHREAYARARRNYLESSVLKSSQRYGIASPQRAPALAGSIGPLLIVGVSSALLIGTVASLQYGHTSKDQAQSSIGHSPMSAFAAEPLITSRGQIRTFALKDGSSITLDSDSAVQIEFSSDIRTVRFQKGRARLEMAADPRPFLLHADRALIEGRKAVIDVDIVDPSNLSVSLLAGAARMSANDGSPGEALARALPSTDIPTQLVGGTGTDKLYGRSDWVTGWAEHREIRLDALLIAANRYAKHPIELQEKSVGSTLLTGRFHIANTDQFLQHIGTLLGLHRHDWGEKIILTKK